MLSSIFLSSWLALFNWIAPPAAGQPPVSVVGITMNSLVACRVDLTELGRRTTFSGSVFYRSTVDRDGAITGLKPVKNWEFLSQFVQLGQFESCIRRWRFTDAGEYLIRLDAGTTGKTLTEWEVNVSVDNKSLSVILPGGITGSK